MTAPALAEALGVVKMKRAETEEERASKEQDLIGLRRSVTEKVRKVSIWTGRRASGHFSHANRLRCARRAHTRGNGGYMVTDRCRLLWREE